MGFQVPSRLGVVLVDPHREDSCVEKLRPASAQDFCGALTWMVLLVLERWRRHSVESPPSSRERIAAVEFTNPSSGKKWLFRTVQGGADAEAVGDRTFTRTEGDHTIKDASVAKRCAENEQESRLRVRVIAMALAVPQM